MAYPINYNPYNFQMPQLQVPQPQPQPQHPQHNPQYIALL